MAKHVEPPPWASRYGDDRRHDLPAPFAGSHNVGSYDMAAAVGAVELADELLRTQGAVPVSPESAEKLGVILLRLADSLQERLRKRSLYTHAMASGASPDPEQVRAQLDGMDLVDRSGGSHVRARGALRTVVEALPLPVGADEGALRAWAAEVDSRAYRLLSTAHDVGYCARPDGEDPFAELAAALEHGPENVPTPA
jgi:hypothetical protein